MLLSIAAVCIVLGCLFWVYRVFSETIPAFSKQTIFNKIEVVLLLMLVCSVVPSSWIAGYSTMQNNQLKTEFLNIYMSYDDNMMMDDSSNNYLLWMPPYDSTDQFMASTEALLGLRLGEYNEKVWNKQKTKQNSVYGDLIKLSVKPIIMIVDPTSIVWIEEG